ncbi:unnamed protein product, partial [Prorocentrum cordatum]
ASFLSFTVDVHEFSATETAMHNAALWDKHLVEYNSGASRFANGAFQTAGLWVRAEAQQELIFSTVLTFGLVILFALLGMLVFTRDWCLSLMVVASTCMVVNGLAFFMVVVLGWAIGPIEVISLIVFIGYGVTYSLHIAHRYGFPEAEHSRAAADLQGAVEARFKRTKYALQSIGPAAAGSAATTAGASVFLLFCTLTIFQKLGGVVLCVTTLSILMALVALCAALFSFGPVDPGGRLLPPVWRYVEPGRQYVSQNSRMLG